MALWAGQALARKPKPLPPDPRAQLGAKALGILHGATVSEDGDVRVLACEQWGPIGNPTARPLLAAALKDPSPYVRIAAAGSLFQLGDVSGVSIVEAIVKKAPPSPKSDDPLDAYQEMRAIAANKVRVVAIKTLALMGRPSSLGVLQDAKRDSDGSVRDAGAVALAKLGSSEDLAQFAQALQDDDPLVREKAVRALGEVATSGAMAYLKPMAKDPNYQVRAAAMESLGATGNAAALPELSAGAEDQNELVRSKAVAALGRVGSPSAVRFLKDALEHATNVYMQLLATAGLFRIGEKSDLMPAQRALSQPDVDTRVLAVEVLEDAGGDKSVELLESALDDKELRVRVRAAAALVKLLQKKPAKP